MGVLIGGIWAIFRWIHEEKLRRLSSVPSIDGELSAACIHDGMSKDAIVTLTALWRNRGSFAVPIDPKWTQISVFELAAESPLGPINLEKEFEEPSFRHFVYSEVAKIALEPKTDSKITTHFRLLEGRNYLFSWSLAMADPGRPDVHVWNKELVVAVPSRKQLTQNSDDRDLEG